MSKGYRNLDVWREAKALAVAVYRATNGLGDLSLRDQIRRAEISVPSNIAEGDERDTDKDAVRFFFIAKGSLAELSTQLEIASEVGFVPFDTAAPLQESIVQLARRLGALINHRSNR